MDRKVTIMRPTKIVVDDDKCGSSCPWREYTKTCSLFPAKGQVDRTLAKAKNGHSYRCDECLAAHPAPYEVVALSGDSRVRKWGLKMHGHLQRSAQTGKVLEFPSRAKARAAGRSACRGVYTYTASFSLKDVALGVISPVTDTFGRPRSVSVQAKSAAEAKRLALDELDERLRATDARVRVTVRRTK